MAIQLNEVKVQKDVAEDISYTAWTLKNHDWSYIQSKLKEAESTDPANTSYKSIYSKVVNKEYSSITEEDYETLRQVLKYKKGFYEKGDEIADIPGDGNGEFQLLDPGYYLIEISAPGGKQPTIDMTSYLTNNAEWKTTDGKLVLKFGKADSTDKMWWTLRENDAVIAGGKYELNEQAVFLYKANNILSERKTYSDLIKTIRSRDDTSSKPDDYIDYYNDLSRDERFHIYKENISMLNDGDLIYSSDEHTYTYLKSDISDSNKIYSCSKYSHNDLYDFFEHHLNVFEDKKNFCKIIFSIKGYEFYANNPKVYEHFTIVTGMHRDTLNATAISDGKNGNKADYDIFKSLVDAGSFKDFEVKKLFTDTTCCNAYNALVASKTNGTYCTDGSHIYLIANIDAAVCNNKFTYKMDNGASQVELSNPSFMTIKVGFGGLSKREHEASQTDITKGQLDLGFGEKPFTEDEDNTTLNEDGKAVFEIDGKAVNITASGGGGRGAGMRRNDYGTLYWQDAEPGYIKIKYLGDASLECSTMSISCDGKELHTLTAGKNGGTSFTVSNSSEIKVPNDTDIPIEINARSYTGNLLPDGIINKDSQLLSLRKVTKSYYKCGNIYRDYYEHLSSKSEISYKFYEHGDYLGIEDSTNGYTVESIYDGFSEGRVAVTNIADIKFEMQNYDFNLNLMCLYNNVTVEDNETFDALKKTTTLQNKGTTKQNIYIHNTLDQVFQLSLEYSNTLDLEALYEFNDNSIVTLKRVDNARIAYSQMQFSKYTKTTADDNSVYYKEKTKVKVSGGQKVFITFFFSSQRLRIDETMSNFPNSTVFYPILYVPDRNSPEQLDFDVSEDKENNNNWKGADALKENGIGGSRSFQVVEMTMPFASLSITAYVKKNSYKVNILNDLYLNILPTVLSQKEEFEYGESVAIRFFLQKSMKVSNLKCFDESIEKQDIMYIQNNIKNIYPESFFSIGDAYQRISNFSDDTAELQYCEEEIKNLTDKVFFKDTLKYELFCARNSVSSAEASDDKDNNGKDLFKLRNIYKNFDPSVVKSLSDDYPIIVVHMSQNSLSLRLTSDYLLFSEVACIENGSSLGLSIFKRAHFLLMASAGRTGNGGNGVSNTPTTGIGRNGGNGGDGYIGGNGGDGTGTSDWAPKVTWWNNVIPSNFGIVVAAAGGGGLGGRGFFGSGALGRAGQPANGRFHQLNITEFQYTNLSISGLGAVPVYIGCHYLGVVTLQKAQKNASNNQHVNAVLSLKAGVAGQNGLDGEKQNDKLSGYGGAPGTPSYVRVMNDDFYKLKFGENFLSGSAFYQGISSVQRDSNKLVDNTPNSIKSGLFLGPGIRGNSSANNNNYGGWFYVFRIKHGANRLNDCSNMTSTSLTGGLNYFNYWPFFEPIRSSTKFDISMLSSSNIRGDNFSMNGEFFRKSDIYSGAKKMNCLKWSSTEEKLTFNDAYTGLQNMYSILNINECIVKYRSCNSLRDNLINAKIKAISYMSYESGVVIMINLGDVEDSNKNRQNKISPNNIGGFTTDYGVYDTIAENDMTNYANNNVENISTIFNYWR